MNRYLKNGDEASSLPCVLCRNVLEKMNIRWKAYHDGRWICSTESDLPKSIPTSRQNDQVFGRRQQQIKKKEYINESFKGKNRKQCCNKRSV